MRARVLVGIALVGLVFLVGGLIRIGSSATPDGERSGARPEESDGERGQLGAEPSGIEKLDHLIFIVQENRSFDHYFGTFPGAKGFPRDRRGRIKVCLPDPLLPYCARPYHSTSPDQEGGPHGFRASDEDVNGGAMDGFVRTVSTAHKKKCAVQRLASGCKRFLGPRLQPDIMGWHDRREIPNYWKYARNFVLQDRLFAPTDSWTLPAHLFLVSGWSATCADPNDPMSCKSNHMLQSDASRWQYGEDPIYAWTDITWLLHEHGVSWSYYIGQGTCWRPRECEKEVGPWGYTPFSKNVLPGFTDVHETRQLGNVLNHQDYLDAAAAGTLPSVSWLMPGNLSSEHPGSDAGIGKGMAYVTRLINAAMEGPDWESTAIFVTWDDWGGFYDHLEPPRVDEIGYGLRVPAFVVSPYAKEGYIDHQIHSFDSYLKLIEDRFLGAERLDPGTLSRPDSRPTVREEVPILGDMTAAFDFDQPPRPPFILDPTPFD